MCNLIQCDYGDLFWYVNFSIVREWAQQYEIATAAP